MKKGKMSLPMVLGILLILCSFLSMVAIWACGERRVSNSRRIVEQMTQILPAEKPGTPGTYWNVHMPVLELEGTDYVALVEIPAFGLKLPVADQWTGQGLYAQPGRLSGSAYDHSLVIGGADDDRQFGFCKRISHGQTVTVTDMTGTCFTFTVSRIDRASRADTTWLAGTDYDLTLFCRDSYSLEYIAVRCTFGR